MGDIIVFKCLIVIWALMCTKNSSVSFSFLVQLAYHSSSAYSTLIFSIHIGGEKIKNQAFPNGLSVKKNTNSRLYNLNSGSPFSSIVTYTPILSPFSFVEISTKIFD